MSEPRVKIEAGEAYPEVDIATDVIAAAKELANIRERGYTVDPWVARPQRGMLDEWRTPLQELILQGLNASRRSSKKIGALLTAYVDLAMAEGSPKGGGLFEVPRATLLPAQADLWENAK